MDNIKTIEETLELLKQGKTLRYHYMIGSVIFSPEFNKYPIIGISIKDFLKLRSDGIIDCESGVKKYDSQLMRSEYQEYSLKEEIEK